MWNVRHEADQTDELPPYDGPLSPGFPADGIPEEVRAIYETLRFGTVHGSAERDFIRGYTIQTGDMYEDGGEEVKVYAYASQEELEKFDAYPEGSEYGDEGDGVWLDRVIRTLATHVAETLYGYQSRGTYYPEVRHRLAREKRGEL